MEVLWVEYGCIFGDYLNVVEGYGLYDPLAMLSEFKFRYAEPRREIGLEAATNWHWRPWKQWWWRSKGPRQMSEWGSYRSRLFFIDQIVMNDGDLYHNSMLQFGEKIGYDLRLNEFRVKTVRKLWCPRMIMRVRWDYLLRDTYLHSEGLVPVWSTMYDGKESTEILTMNFMYCSGLIGRDKFFFNLLFFYIDDIVATVMIKVEDELLRFIIPFIPLYFFFNYIFEGIYFLLRGEIVRCNLRLRFEDIVFLKKYKRIVRGFDLNLIFKVWLQYLNNFLSDSPRSKNYYFWWVDCFIVCCYYLVYLNWLVKISFWWSNVFSKRSGLDTLFGRWKIFILRKLDRSIIFVISMGSMLNILFIHLINSVFFNLWTRFPVSVWSFFILWRFLKKKLVIELSVAELRILFGRSYMKVGRQFYNAIFKFWVQAFFYLFKVGKFKQWREVVLGKEKIEAEKQKYWVDLGLILIFLLYFVVLFVKRYRRFINKRVRYDVDLYLSIFRETYSRFFAHEALASLSESKFIWDVCNAYTINVRLFLWLCGILGHIYLYWIKCSIILKGLVYFFYSLGNLKYICNLVYMLGFRFFWFSCHKFFWVLCVYYDIYFYFNFDVQLYKFRIWCIDFIIDRFVMVPSLMYSFFGIFFLIGFVGFEFKLLVGMIVEYLVVYNILFIPYIVGVILSTVISICNFVSCGLEECVSDYLRETLPYFLKGCYRNKVVIAGNWEWDGVLIDEFGESFVVDSYNFSFLWHERLEKLDSYLELMFELNVIKAFFLGVFGSRFGDWLFNFMVSSFPINWVFFFLFSIPDLDIGMFAPYLMDWEFFHIRLHGGLIGYFLGYHGFVNMFIYIVYLFKWMVLMISNLLGCILEIIWIIFFFYYFLNLSGVFCFLKNMVYWYSVFFVLGIGSIIEGFGLNLSAIIYFLEMSLSSFFFHKSLISAYIFSFDIFKYFLQEFGEILELPSNSTFYPMKFEVDKLNYGEWKGRKDITTLIKDVKGEITFYENLSGQYWVLGFGVISYSWFLGLCYCFIGVGLRFLVHFFFRGFYWLYSFSTFSKEEETFPFCAWDSFINSVFFDYSKFDFLVALNGGIAYDNIRSDPWAYQSNKFFWLDYAPINETSKMVKSLWLSNVKVGWPMLLGGLDRVFWRDIFQPILTFIGIVYKETHHVFGVTVFDVHKFQPLNAHLLKVTRWTDGIYGYDDYFIPYTSSEQARFQYFKEFLYNMPYLLYSVNPIILYKYWNNFRILFPGINVLLYGSLNEVPMSELEFLGIIKKRKYKELMRYASIVGPGGSFGNMLKALASYKFQLGSGSWFLRVIEGHGINLKDDDVVNIESQQNFDTVNWIHKINHNYLRKMEFYLPYLDTFFGSSWIFEVSDEEMEVIKEDLKTINIEFLSYSAAALVGVADISAFSDTTVQDFQYQINRVVDRSFFISEESFDSSRRRIFMTLNAVNTLRVSEIGVHFICFLIGIIIKYTIIEHYPFMDFLYLYEYKRPLINIRNELYFIYFILTFLSKQDIEVWFMFTNLGMFWNMLPPPMELPDNFYGSTKYVADERIFIMYKDLLYHFLFAGYGVKPNVLFSDKYVAYERLLDYIFSYFKSDNLYMRIYYVLKDVAYDPEFRKRFEYEEDWEVFVNYTFWFVLNMSKFLKWLKVFLDTQVEVVDDRYITSFLTTSVLKNVIGGYWAIFPSKYRGFYEIGISYDYEEYEYLFAKVFLYEFMRDVRMEMADDGFFDLTTSNDEFWWPIFIFRSKLQDHIYKSWLVLGIKESWFFMKCMLWSSVIGGVGVWFYVCRADNL